MIRFQILRLALFAISWSITSFSAVAHAEVPDPVEIEASGMLVHNGYDDYRVRVWTENSVVRVEYPEWNCAGTLTLRLKSETRLEFDERLRPGSHSCGGGGYVVLRKDDTENWIFQWLGTKGGRHQAEGRVNLTLRSAPKQGTASNTRTQKPAVAARQEEPTPPTTRRELSVTDFGIKEPTIKAEPKQLYPPVARKQEKIQSVEEVDASPVAGLETSSPNVVAGPARDPATISLITAIDRALALLQAALAENSGDNAAFVQGGDYWEFSYVTQSSPRRFRTHYRPLHSETVCEDPSSARFQCTVTIQQRESGCCSNVHKNGFNTKQETLVFQFDPDRGGLTVIEVCEAGTCYQMPAVSDGFRQAVLGSIKPAEIMTRAPLPDVDHVDYTAFEIAEGTGQYVGVQVLYVRRSDVGYGYAGQGLQPGQVIVTSNGDGDDLGVSTDPEDILRIFATLPQGKTAWVRFDDTSSLELRRTTRAEYEQRVAAAAEAAQEAARQAEEDERMRTAAAPLLSELKTAEERRQRQIANSDKSSASIRAADEALSRAALPIAKQLLALAARGSSGQAFRDSEIRQCVLLERGENPTIVCFTDLIGNSGNSNPTFNPKVHLYPATQTFKLSEGAGQRYSSGNPSTIAQGCRGSTIIVDPISSGTGRLAQSSTPVDTCKKIIYVPWGKSTWGLHWSQWGFFGSFNMVMYNP